MFYYRSTSTRTLFTLLISSPPYLTQKHHITMFFCDPHRPYHVSRGTLPLSFLLCLWLLAQNSVAFVTKGEAITFASVPTTTTTTTRLWDTPAEKNKSQEEEDPVTQLPLWQAQLHEAKTSGRQLELQTKIDDTKTSSEFGVRRAQVEFYDAFSDQSMEGMKHIWSTNHDCECIHPGMASIRGRTAILNSWEILFEADAFRIEPSETQIDVCGSTAICRCIESVGESTKLEALNIYKRDNGSWKLTLHMASPVANLLDGDGGNIII